MWFQFGNKFSKKGGNLQVHFGVHIDVLNLHCQMLPRQGYFYYMGSPALSRISKYFVGSATNYCYIQSWQSTQRELFKIHLLLCFSYETN